MKKIYFPLLFLLSFSWQLRAEISEEIPLSCRLWVDSVMATMDTQARIGQLFMPAAVPDAEGDWFKKVCVWIRDKKIGGLYFSRGDVSHQVLATNAYQRLAAETGQPPILLGADAEWGLAMRLPGTMVFPHNTMLGAVRDTSLLFAYGAELARQCRRVGIQVDFGPVADVNNNPENPVINVRSFGSDPWEVARRTSAFAQGLASENVLPVAKHFPGHGNTAEDSHEQLAKVHNSRRGMDSTELLPFRYLIENGLEGVMVGHLSVPALDTVTHLPSSQSSVIVNGFLRDTLGFHGLAFTDAMAMKGALAGYSGLNCIRALQAGNDILLNPTHLEADMRAVEEAVNKGVLSKEQIDEKCRKVLTYKYVLGLTSCPQRDTAHLMRDLHQPSAEALNRRLNEEAMTLLRNEKDFVPLRHIEGLRTAALLLGEKEPAVAETAGKAPCPDNPFARTLKLYQETMDVLYLTEGNELDLRNLTDALSGYDRILVGVYANTPMQRNWLKRLQPMASRLCLTFFTSPYTLASHGEILRQASAVLCAYETTPLAQEAAAEALMGGIDIRGRLPVSIGSYYRHGEGLEADKSRLSYGLPEQEGFSSALLCRVDTIMSEAIEAKAFPGGQLLVAKNGRVVWHKAYGWIDAENSRPVETTDLYDLASLTKVMATTPAVMSLCESGRIRLDEPVSDHLPALRGTDKEKLSYRNMLYHESRLTPYIGFYQHLIDTASLGGIPFVTFHCDSLHPDRFDANSWVPSSFRFTQLMSSQPRDSFTLKVAEQMYIHSSFRDSVVRIICDSELRRNVRYCYSDLGFILMGFAAETIAGCTLDYWAENHLYAPLGACTTLYHPLDRFPLERIVPTALDTTLRHQLLRGYPHDEAAAFLGGVSGNAGLFSSANDVAKYLQMLLFQGTYGGHRFFEPSTVRFFTGKRSRLSRRMLGFDAAEPNVARVQTTSELAPKSTFGHTGFTGTCFWVDPVNQLIFILLTNRIQPDRTNNVMLSLNVRTRLHDTLYEAMVE